MTQTQCLAVSDDLVSWRKWSDNPLIEHKPAGTGECFRDPCVWREGADWFMLVGSEDANGRGGVALLYHSRDLISWTGGERFHEERAEVSGHDFECPDFFKLEERHLLLTSRNRTYWHMGSYQKGKFQSLRVGPVDGPDFYAGKTAIDHLGRRILWGWIPETRPESEQVAAGWSGVLSLPRVLGVGPENSLTVTPAPELKSLRHEHLQLAPLTLSAQGSTNTHFYRDVPWDCFELQIRAELSDDAEFKLLPRPGGDPDDERGVVASKGMPGDIPFKISSDDLLEMRVFVDKSVVESFANNTTSWTSRAYAQEGDTPGFALTVVSGEVRFHSIDVWEMRP